MTSDRHLECLFMCNLVYECDCYKMFCVTKITFPDANVAVRARRYDVSRNDLNVFLSGSFDSMVKAKTHSPSSV